MSDNPVKGSCLCSGVAYEVEPPFKLFQYCHCSRCRKVSGSVHSANLYVPPAQFRWTQGSELVLRYDMPEAKYFTTAFCLRCGSSLPWEPKGGKIIVVPAGTLDEDPGVRPVQNIHWASRAPWCLETGELPKHAVLPPRT